MGQALLVAGQVVQAAEETLVLVTEPLEQRELQTLAAEPVAAVMAQQVKTVGQVLLYCDTLTEHL